MFSFSAINQQIYYGLANLVNHDRPILKQHFAFIRLSFFFFCFRCPSTSLLFSLLSFPPWVISIPSHPLFLCLLSLLLSWVGCYCARCGPEAAAAYHRWKERLDQCPRARSQAPAQEFSGSWLTHQSTGCWCHRGLFYQWISGGHHQGNPSLSSLNFVFLSTFSPRTISFFSSQYSDPTFMAFRTALISYQSLC